METENNHQSIIEALLFASDKPLSLERIQVVIKDVTTEQIEETINSLNEKYRAGGHSFAIKKIARGYQIYTLPDFAPWIKALFSHNRRERLSFPALEVLSIVAYKQPIVKSEIDRFRGVNSEGPLLTLMDRKLITIVGRKPAAGRPLLYGTTQEFLTHFGLNDLNDLPRMEELEMMLKRKETSSFPTNPVDDEKAFEKIEDQNNNGVMEGKIAETEEESFSPEVPAPPLAVNLPFIEKQDQSETEIPINLPSESSPKVSPKDEAE